MYALAHIGKCSEKTLENNHRSDQMGRAKRKRVFEHALSLIRAFTLHKYILLCLMILLADSEGPDQTARMRSLIWAIAVRICPKTRFRVARPILAEIHIKLGKSQK